MVGIPHVLGSLALGLIAGASASPVLSEGLNSTSSIRFTNETTIITTIKSTTTLYEVENTISAGVPSAGSSIAGPAAVQPSLVAVSQSSNQGSGPSVAASSVSSIARYGAVPVAANQASSPASFQTIVVTETVAGCSLGASPAASASTSVNGQAPFAVATSSSTSTSYAASTLLPAVHWDYPVDDIQNLAPSNDSNLYYSAGGVSDPSVQHLFASLSTTLSYESVVLDHSSFVASTSCSDNGILVTFTSGDALNYAAESWSIVSSGFVLVTYTDGCHGVSDQQRTFWLIDSLDIQNATTSILATVEQEIAVEDAMCGVDMQWGTYYPASNTTNGTSSTSGSSTSAGSSSSSTFDSTSRASSSSSGSGSYSGGNSTSSSTSDSTPSYNSTSNGSSCGAAPSTTIDGLPAADCGDPTFDADIDNTTGYLDFSSADANSSLSDFAPDVTFTSDEETDGEDDPDLTRRSAILRKRSWFKSLWHAAVTIVKTTYKVATAPARLLATAVKNIPVVGNFIASKTEFDPSITGSEDINLGPDANAVSPWGNAAQIYTKSKTSSTDASNTADITIYCVDCGVKGHVALAGQAKWNLLDGLHGLNAAISANIQAGVNLGLVANAQYSDTKSKELVRAPLPEVGIAVKGVFSAGVYLSVDAVSTVSVTAEGQALVGVVMTIPNFQANLNLFDQNGAGSSSVTGFNPTFTKRFEATGQIAASLQLALPIAINCGFEVPALNLKRAISLIEQPSLYGNMTTAGNTANVAAASETCNNGIEYFANRMLISLSVVSDTNIS